MRPAMSSKPPPFVSGRRTLGVFICGRCGDGIVHPIATAPANHNNQCQKRSGVDPRTEAELFRALLDMDEGSPRQ